MDPIIARVGMPVPVDKLFDFLVPEELHGDVSVGRRVRVRFAGRQTTGVVVELASESSFDGRLASIEAMVDGPVLARDSLEICRVVADECYAPLGLCINRILPGSISRSSHMEFRWAGTLEDAERWLDSRSKRAPRQADVVRLLLREGGAVDDMALRGVLGASGIAAARRLVSEQSALVRKVESEKGESGGEDEVTPSRTAPLKRPKHVISAATDRWRVYNDLIQDALSDGGSVLVLAPTVLQAEHLAQIWLRSRKRRRDETGGTSPIGAASTDIDGDSSIVGIYHSDLSEGMRGRVWEQARHGRVRILFGTRSALFVPLAGCRLIVIEDEHDSGYKQEEQLPYYDARKVAQVAASLRGAKLVLASASPSMETVLEVRNHEAEYVAVDEDNERIEATIVPVGYGEDILHPVVVDAVHKAVTRGDRVMIVASRLGSFRCVICRDCGRAIRCPNCGGNLAYDDRSVQLYCRICGHSARQPRCSVCGATDLRFVGLGTAAVETAVREAFPTETVTRLDATTLTTAATRRRAQSVLWGDAVHCQPRILIVSPMAAAGPRLLGVGCAVVIGIDAILALPNFRASEQALQLLMSVRGRIERGTVYVQTRFPEHEALEAFEAGDYDRFVERELEHRRAMFYPPYSVLAQLRFAAETRDSSSRVAQAEKALRRLPVVVLGPTATPGGGARTLTLLLKAKTPGNLRAACDAVHAVDPRVEINPDPVWF